MRDQFARWRSDGVPLAVAAPLAAAAVALGLVAAAAVAFLGSDPDTPPVVAAGTPSDTASYSTPPAAEVRRVHRALHDFNTWCTPGADARARRQLQRDAELIVAFTRRHPTARFPIDDETGNPLSLLLVTRNELRECAPAAAAVADRALPPNIRRGLTPLRSPGKK